MRERIVITTPTGYTKTASGQIDASGDASAVVWADVRKGVYQQDINMDQNQIENAYTFEVREGLSIQKDSRITWESNVYSILNIGQESGYRRFVKIIAARTT
jgi:head-tail adaptor